MFVTLMTVMVLLMYTDSKLITSFALTIDNFFLYSYVSLT